MYSSLCRPCHRGSTCTIACLLPLLCMCWPCRHAVHLRSHCDFMRASGNRWPQRYDFETLEFEISYETVGTSTLSTWLPLAPACEQGTLFSPWFCDLRSNALSQCQHWLLSRLTY
jgi:hypothetical protein